MTVVISDQVHRGPDFRIKMNPLPGTVNLATQRNRNHLQLVFTQPGHKAVDTRQPIVYQKIIVVTKAQLPLTKFYIVMIEVTLDAIFFLHPLIGITVIKKHGKGTNTIDL